MEEVENHRNTSKYPSLPANYVSLATLEDRWLKEKQRKERGKQEEEEGPKLREKQQEESPKREEKEKHKNNQKKPSENGGENRRTFKGNCRYQSGARDHRRPMTTIYVIKSKLEEESQNEAAASAAVVVVPDEQTTKDEPNKLNNNKTKKFNNWRRDRKNRRAGEENLTDNGGDTVQLGLAIAANDAAAEKEVEEEKIPEQAVVAERNGGGKEEGIVTTTSDFRRRNGGNRKVWERKVITNRQKTVNIRRNVEDLSINGNIRPTLDMMSENRKYSAVTGSFDRRGRHGNGHLVWVKKEETTTDASTNGAGGRSCSGTQVKAGTKKKNPGRSS